MLEELHMAIGSGAKEVWVSWQDRGRLARAPLLSTRDRSCVEGLSVMSAGGILV